jgi:hypothetical protein
MTYKRMFFDPESFLVKRIKEAVRHTNENKTYEFPNGGKDANYKDIVNYLSQKYSKVKYNYSPETITRTAREMAKKGVLVRTSQGRYCLPENFYIHQYTPQRIRNVNCCHSFDEK